MTWAPGVSSAVLDAADEFIAELRRRHIEGSLATAKRTAEILRLVITKSRHPAPGALLDDVRIVGTRLQAAKPLELAIGNIVRRVLHLIREESQQVDEEDMATQRSVELEAGQTPRGVHFALEETHSSAAEGGGHGLLSRALRPSMLATRTLSLHNLLDHSIGSDVEPEDRQHGAASAADARVSMVHPSHDSLLSGASSRPSSHAPSEAGEADVGDGGRRSAFKHQKNSKTEVWKGRATVIEEMNELLDELDDIDTNIAQQAVEHIHANEVILTFAASNSVALFLREASKKRSFQLVAAEGSPSFRGHAMAMETAQLGVPTTLIPDAAIFAMMARVNKVLVGAHALLANGGIIAPAGTALVALAAKKHAVPLVVLVGLHKLSPLFPHDPNVTFNDFKSPGVVLEYDAIAETLSAEQADDDATAESTYLQAPNPKYDYVAPELINLFVTDTGGYTPSYVYRLLAEYYTRDDFELTSELTDTLVR